MGFLGMKGKRYKLWWSGNSDGTGGVRVLVKEDTVFRGLNYLGYFALFLKVDTFWKRVPKPSSDKYRRPFILGDV